MVDLITLVGVGMCGEQVECNQRSPEVEQK